MFIPCSNVEKTNLGAELKGCLDYNRKPQSQAFGFICIFALSTLYEPRHVIANNVVCATSKGSDQPAHKRSLIRAVASRLNIL